MSNSITGRSSENAVAQDQMQLMLMALELREEAKKREMFGNIAGQVLAIGGQALFTYLDGRNGGCGCRRSNFIPVLSPPRSASFGGSSPFSNMNSVSSMEYALQKALALEW